jgi:hypothetical protein
VRRRTNIPPPHGAGAARVVTNQVMVQIELHTNNSAYEKKVVRASQEARRKVRACTWTSWA